MDERHVLCDGEAFLEKPFDAAGLIEAVSLILHGKKEAVIADKLVPLPSALPSETKPQEP